MSNSSSSNQTASTNQVNFSEHNVSGFYHDLQKKNRLMSVTLHPSTVTTNKGVTWDKVKDGISGKGDIKYRKEPIATAILKEDFTIAIANSWTDFNGGDTLNQIWNSVRPFAAYASYAAEHLQKMSDAGHELGDLGNTAVKFIENAIDTALPYVKKGVDYLNRSLVVQGSRFSYYGGTGTSFGNLAMKFTLFADWKEVSEGSYEYKTVHEQLQELNPYLMGKYVNWDGDSNNSLNQFIGWQTPPGGFKSDVKNVDKFVEGTLLLNFGGYYCIPNIVIRDAQFVFSKQMVKDPKKPNTISPLSCDITLTLQPATKFSDVMLFDFCNGTYTSDDVKKIQDDLTAKLKAIQTKNEQIFGNVTPMVDSEIQRPEGSESMTDYDRPMFT